MYPFFPRCGEKGQAMRGSFLANDDFSDNLLADYCDGEVAH
jgi:hypothetical protein